MVAEDVAGSVGRTLDGKVAVINETLKFALEATTAGGGEEFFGFGNGNRAELEDVTEDDANLGTVKGKVLGLEGEVEEANFGVEDM